MPNILFMARLTDPDDFAAVRRAEKLLGDHGFSVGHMQRGEPRGILHGNFDIQKWRNLSPAHREALHGLMAGHRAGHVSIEIYDNAPLDATRRLAESLHGADHTIILTPLPINSSTGHS